MTRPSLDSAKSFILVYRTRYCARAAAALGSPSSEPGRSGGSRPQRLEEQETSDGIRPLCRRAGLEACERWPDHRATPLCDSSQDLGPSTISAGRDLGACRTCPEVLRQLSGSTAHRDRCCFLRFVSGSTSRTWHTAFSIHSSMTLQLGPPKAA